MKNEYIEWVSIDDLIKKLEEQKELLGGDGAVPVCLNGISAIYLNPLPYYYDGGYYALDASDKTNVKHSRENQGVSAGFHEMRIDLVAVADDYDMKMNGRNLTEIDPENWNWYDKMQQKERMLFDGQLVKYRLLEEANKKWGCYPFEASLASGEKALGETMKDAKEALIEIYKKH